jgi:hypothetical protein
MDDFVCSLFRKVIEMPDSNNNGRLQDYDRQIEPVNDVMAPDEDFTMEQILDNINNTPLGQVLKRIATLPEIRKEKVLRVRRQLPKESTTLVRDWMSLSIRSLRISPLKRGFIPQITAETTLYFFASATLPSKAAENRNTFRLLPECHRRAHPFLRVYSPAALIFPLLP